MVNYDELPLFPLHVVLYPEMPLPLHIFEPRYREMAFHCRETNSPFGVVLIQKRLECTSNVIPHSVGTVAHITQFEEQSDGRMNLVVTGGTRFRVSETSSDRAYLTAKVVPFDEDPVEDPIMEWEFDEVTELFKTYLISLLAVSNRRLSALQLPQDPKDLSYAIASVLQISLHEKQILLEMTKTKQRLHREAELLRQEIEVQDALKTLQMNTSTHPNRIISPVDTTEISKLCSLN